MSSEVTGAPETGNEGNEGGGLDPNLYPGIDKVPAQYREHIDPILKEINNNANTHISKVNSELEAWKPYAELGLRDIEPEQVEGLIQFYQMVANAEDDPSQLQAWWSNLGEQMGWTGEGEEGEFEEEEGEPESEGLTLDDVRGVVEELVSPLYDERDQEGQVRGEEQADRIITDEFTKIKQDNPGLELDEDMETAIATFGMKYPGPSGSILKGFEDYKAFVEKTQGKLFTKVEGAPNPGEGPGTPNTAPPRIKSMKDATLAVKQALENSAAQ